MTNNIYKNLLVKNQISILSGQSTSTICNCIEVTGGAGAATLRAIAIPSGFMNSNITITVYDDELGTNPKSLSVSDGQNKGSFLLPACVAGECIGIVAQQVDFIGYFSITTSNTQTQNITLDVWLQPIYQGNA